MTSPVCFMCACSHFFLKKQRHEAGRNLPCGSHSATSRRKAACGTLPSPRCAARGAATARGRPRRGRERRRGSARPRSRRRRGGGRATSSRKSAGGSSSEIEVAVHDVGARVDEGQRLAAPSAGAAPRGTAARERGRRRQVAAATGGDLRRGELRGGAQRRLGSCRASRGRGGQRSPVRDVSSMKLCMACTGWRATTALTAARPARARREPRLERR